MSDAASKAPPLDDVMLAMDVVDTLRHRQILVDRELQSENRDQRMLERLRQIYASQGIEVPERVLAEGVSALKEDRFLYTPSAGGLAGRLARIYVGRGKWGKPLLAVAGVVIVAWLGYSLLVTGPAKRHLAALPDELSAVHRAVVAQAHEPDVDLRADALFARGRGAVDQGDVQTADESLAELGRLQEALQSEYELRIVSRPDEYSGVWRIPERNPNARNFYVIVEAVTPDGQVLSLPITAEEDGKTRVVDKWGLRVDQRIFEAVAADKQDDGIIQNRRFGLKKPGFLDPEYLIPTTGAAITSW